MSNHTPGPWRFTRDHTPGQYGINERIRDRHNSVICNLHINAEANARLIAAAPDLLAALQGLAWAVSGIEYVETEYAEQVAQARAAIAEAQGEG